MENIPGKKLALYFASFFLALSFFLLRPAASTAQQVSLAISPPLLEVLIKPGKSILIAYKLDNFGDPVIVSTYVLPFEPADSTGQIRIKDELVGPIRFTLENADLELGSPSVLKTLQSQQYLLRIRVPEGAPEGDYYYTFLAQTEPPPSIGGVTNSRARAAIGSNILITVSNTGKIDIQPKISTFDVLPRFRLSFLGNTINLFDSNDLIPLVMVVENRGRNFIKPQGEILLRGNFGERATFGIVPQNILSSSRRYVAASPSAELNCDEPHRSALCTTPFSLLLKGFFIGNYKLSTAVSFGEGTPNLLASSSFFAFPFKLTFAFLAVCIIAYILLRKFKNW